MTPRPPTFTPPPTATRRPTSTPTLEFEVGTRTHVGVLMTMTPAPTRVATVERRDPLTLGLPHLAGGLALLLVIAVVVLWRTRLLAHLMVRRAARQGPYAERQAKMIAERDAVLAAARKREKEQKKQTAMIAKDLGGQIREVLTALGYRHDYRNPGARRVAHQKMDFSHCVVVGTESLMFRVGTIPWNTSRYALFEEKKSGEGPWMARELAYALQREVRVSEIEGAGIFVQVGLRHGIAGIPGLFFWRDPRNTELSAMDGNPLEDNKGRMRPPDTETRLQINLGVTANRRIVRCDLRDLPNLLVAGVPGSGKSVFLNQMICTWLERNYPHELELRLIDLKGGIEFDWFSPLQGNLVTQFVDTEDQVAPCMTDLIDEMKRRQARFKGRVKNIRGWNREPRCQPKLPYIVLIVDELSVVMYDNEMRQAVEALLKKAVALGRATGVHLVLCTQVVKVDVLPTMILGNIPAKMVFNAANMRTSMMVLGHGGAAGLAPAGRGFWQNGAEEEILQAPLITDSQIREVVEAAARRQVDPSLAPLKIEEVMQHALENYAGAMPVKAIWKDFMTRISFHDMTRILKSNQYDSEEDGPVFRLPDGQAYHIEAGRPHHPRFVSLHVSDNGKNGAAEPTAPPQKAVPVPEPVIERKVEPEPDETELELDEDAPVDVFDFEALKREMGVTL